MVRAMGSLPKRVLAFYMVGTGQNVLLSHVAWYFPYLTYSSVQHTMRMCLFGHHS